MLSLGQGIAKAAKLPLQYIKDNLKLYLDFKSNKSDTLKFPSEGSTLFDGSDDYIDCGNDSSLQFSGSFSVGCWFKTTDATATNEILVSKSNDGVNDGWLIRLNSSRKLDFGVLLGVISDTGSAVNDGAWHHVVGVHESGVGNKLYKDGVLVASNTTGTDLSNHVPNLHIGNQDYSTPRAINADICNVFAYNRPLSIEEVNSVMRKNYSQLKSVEKTSLVSWWALDSASNTNGAVDSQTETLGTEKITNGGFDADSDWTKSSVTISGGKANFSSGGSTALYQDIGSSLTGLYKVTFEVTDYTSGTLKVYGGAQDSYSDTEPLSATAVGSYTAYIILVGSFNGNIIFGGGSFTGSIDNVSVKEVTSGNTGVITGATTTTSVYGGNAPVLPRAVDVAREGEAEAIGDGSASFDGTDDRIDIGNFTNLNAVSSFTITAWMKRLESNDAVTIEKSADGNNRTGINLYTDGSVYVNIGEGGSAYGGVALAGTDWNHVAVVFDGSLSGNANRAKIYTNGILQTLSFTGTIPSATDSNTDSLYFGYDPVNDVDSTGNISQVGIWRGALTQAQIQSVMESTSYDKIPASVKSTLTEKVTNGAFSSTSGWTEGTGWDINTTTGVASADGTAGFNYLAQSSIFNSNLHKMTITIDSCSNLNNAGIVKNGSVVNFNTGLGISSVGTHTIYFTNSTANLSIYSNGETTTISNISIEEVTNDLVGYWALDESKHLAPSGVPVFGAVVDSTTGENLGDELFTGWINTDCATFSYNSSTKELTATCDGLNQEVHASFSIESGKVYRFEFTTGENYSNTVFLRGIVNDTSLEVYSSSPEINRGYFGTENTYAFYVRATATGTRYVGFRGNSGLTIHITNFSIKEADSNMGLLI